MSRTTFMITGIDEEQGQAWLEGPVTHHLMHVLRRQPGDRIELRDGRGSAWAGTIEAFDSGRVKVRLEERIEVLRESPVEIWLALAYARSDRMDLVLRQAVELGVRRFIAFGSRRSRYRLRAPQKTRRLTRWHKIAEEALCQCGRLQTPSIELCSDLSELLAMLNEEEDSLSFLKILAYEEEKVRGLSELHRVRPRAEKIILMTGPEGGWSRQEVEVLSQSGFIAVRLGPRIMRMETAAVALLTLTQCLWGDLC